VFTPPSVVETKPTDTSPAAVPGSTVGNDAVKVVDGRGATSADSLIEIQVQRQGDLSDVYTRSEGFRTVVVKADEPALVVFRGVPDQYTESGTRISLAVPADAFAHTQPKEVVRLAATLQDGRPLPAWVQFNAQTGQFSGEVPAGTVGELRIKVIARDMQGREATSLFRVNIGVVGNGAVEKDGGKAPAGKTGLSDQLRQRSVAAQRDGRLAALARGTTVAPRG
jgi:hypothetical protein